MQWLGSGMDDSSTGIWEEGNFWPNNYIHMYVYFAKSSDTLLLLIVEESTLMVLVLILLWCYKCICLLYKNL